MSSVWVNFECRMSGNLVLDEKNWQCLVSKQPLSWALPLPMVKLGDFPPDTNQ